MKKTTIAEIIFGLFVIGMIYTVIANNVSITGFVIETPQQLTIISPTDNANEPSGEQTFIFSYDHEVQMQSCALIINDMPAKILNTLMIFTGTKINVKLDAGTYYWKISCSDTKDVKYDSDTRKIVVFEIQKPDFVKTSFLSRQGNLYEFDLKDDLDITIGGVIPNDVLRAKRGTSNYDISILRIVQDYSLGTEFASLLISPGDKRVHINKGQTETVDFNNDGTNDLAIELSDVAYRKATFIIRSANWAAPVLPTIQEPSIVSNGQETDSQDIPANTAGKATAPSVSPTAAKPQTQKSDDTLVLINILLAIIGVILLFAVFILLPKKKEQLKAAVTPITGNKRPRSISKPKPKKKGRNKRKR
jgi:hypothetical protein